MKKYKLTKYEQEILDAYDKGKLLPIENEKEEIKRYQKIAASTLKTKNINLRLSEIDVDKLKSKAIKTGIPYQTLAGSILHRFANDLIKVEL